MRRQSVVLAMICAASGSANAQIMLSTTQVQPGLPTLGSKCPARSIDRSGDAASTLSGKLFSSDGEAHATRDLRVGIAEDDVAALERARAFFSKGASSLQPRLMSVTATLRLAVVLADPHLLDQALAALPHGATGADAARISPTGRSELLAQSAFARVSIIFLQAAAVGGERGSALAAEGERLARAAATNARERGDPEAAADLDRTADAWVLDRAIKAQRWADVDAPLRRLEASIGRETDAERLRWARIDYVDALVGVAQSEAPPTVRRAAAKQALTMLAVIDAELRATSGRAPALEARLDQLAGAVSGRWQVSVPSAAICPMVAKLETDRAAAELALVSDGDGSEILRRLEAADAMLVDVPVYRRGVLAPLLLARASAGARDRAIRWLDEADRRAAHCLCADYRAAITRARAALPNG